MLNALQKRMKRDALSDALISSAPASHRRLVGDDAHRAADDAREADHDVLRVSGLHFQEVAVSTTRGMTSRMS